MAFRTRKWVPAAAVMLALIHAGLLAWAGYRDSATYDEVGHFAAGLSHWRYGNFNLYRVNPPLVRLAACLPVVLFMDPPIGFGQEYRIKDPGWRGEFPCGAALARANGNRYSFLLAMARWGAIPFSLLGGWVCFLWARELYGDAAAILAMSLWVFCPNILAHGHLITPDVGAASLGVTAAYVFWKWLKRPSLVLAMGTGLALGLAEMSKATWIVLYLLWPIAWLLYRYAQPRAQRSCSWQREAVHVSLMFVLSLWILNLGYGFEGSFRPLGQFGFMSRSFGGESSRGMRAYDQDNRFRTSWLGKMPVPVPENYLMGIDVQKWDFERGKWSYLKGEWRWGGWWYYYLYALLIKVPLGTWVLLGGAIIAGAFFRGYAAPARDELCLLLPLLAVLILVSSQTGFSHHI